MTINNKPLKFVIILLITIVFLRLLYSLNSSHKYNIGVENTSLQDLEISIEVDKKLIVDTTISQFSALNSFSFIADGGINNFIIKINGIEYEENILVLKRQSAMIYLGRESQSTDEITFHFFNYYGSYSYCPSPLPFPDSLRNNNFPDTFFLDNREFFIVTPNDSLR
jgi:hypothetical protein